MRFFSELVTRFRPEGALGSFYARFVAEVLTVILKSTDLFANFCGNFQFFSKSSVFVLKD